MLLAETNEGYHNLIKLVSSGYTEGFYYKPRIDKDLLAQHSEGLIGLSQLPQGRGRRGHLQGPAARRRAPRRRTTATSSARTTSSSRCMYQGLDEQKSRQPRPARHRAATSACRWSCTNDVHYLREDDYKPHDILLCIGTGKTVNDADRLRYHGDQFFLKTPEEMAEIFAEFPDALANTVRIAERVDVNLASGVNHLPDFDVPAGFTVDTYFEHMVREGFAARLPRLQALMARSALRYTLDEYERAPGLRDRDDPADGVRRVLPDRLGLHPLRARARHPGRPGPRLGGRQSSSPGACASPTSIRSSST